ARRGRSPSGRRTGGAARASPGYTLRAIDPEVCVGQAGPRETAGRAPGRRLLRVDQEAQPPALAHAREQVDVVGQPGRRRRDRGNVERSDVVLPHEVDGLTTQELDAVEAAALHDHLREG